MVERIDVVTQQMSELEKQKQSLENAKRLGLGGSIVKRITNSIASLQAKIKEGVASVGEIISGGISNSAATADNNSTRLSTLINNINKQSDENKKRVEDTNRKTNQAILQQAGQQAALAESNVRRAGLSENAAILTQAQLQSQAANQAAQNEQSNLDRILNIDNNRASQVSNIELNKAAQEAAAANNLNQLLLQQAQYLQSQNATGSGGYRYGGGGSGGGTSTKTLAELLAEQQKKKKQEKMNDATGFDTAGTLRDRQLYGRPVPNVDPLDVITNRSGSRKDTLSAIIVDPNKSSKQNAKDLQKKLKNLGINIQ